MSETVEGKDLTLHFDGERCIHARNCVLGLPQVFQANVEGPWINPDAAPADELAALARRCPSGAITYDRKDGVADEARPVRNAVQVQENGPLAVRADLLLGGAPVTPRATLCRCGGSSRKPYCDGTHKTNGFVATGEPATAAEVATLTETGPMVLNPIPNGPLMVTGPVEVTAGSGRTVQRGTKLFLCRCGGSQNKPFCDGQHRAIGFTAP